MSVLRGIPIVGEVPVLTLISLPTLPIPAHWAFIGAQNLYSAAFSNCENVNS